MNNGYIGAGQFARDLSYSMAYTYALISSGKISAIKRDGKWFIPSEEITKRKQRRKQKQHVASSK
jgi:hypothetical protein